jgi:hypothetical protein
MACIILVKRIPVKSLSILAFPRRVEDKLQDKGPHLLAFGLLFDDFLHFSHPGWSICRIFPELIGDPSGTPYCMATDKELSDFLESVERRAFKQAVYAVRKDEAALDIVQDAMIKLAEKYGDKPVDELPMLFQRILQNTIHDFFRREKVRNTWVSLFSSFGAMAAMARAAMISTCSRAWNRKTAPRPPNPARTRSSASRR